MSGKWHLGINSDGYAPCVVWHLGINSDGYAPCVVCPSASTQTGLLHGVFTR